MSKRELPENHISLKVGGVSVTLDGSKPLDEQISGFPEEVRAKIKKAFYESVEMERRDEIRAIFEGKEHSLLLEEIFRLQDMVRRT